MIMCSGKSILVEGDKEEYEGGNKNEGDEVKVHWFLMKQK